MMNTSFGTATARQRFALFCITKKDYREVNISKEEASEIIANAKRGVVSTPAKKDNGASKLEKDFIAWFKEHTLGEVVGELRDALGIVSIVENDPNYMKEKKSYVMRGFGCSISYLKYDGRSKRAKELEEIFRKLRFTTFEKMVVNAFPKALANKLEREGNPIGALYCQDFNVNNTLYNSVVSFAHSIGIKSMDYVTRLD